MNYAAFSLLFLAAALLPAVVVAVRRLRHRPWWLAVLVTAAVLLVLTVVFDSLMVAGGLFHYDQERSLHVDVGLTPLEDLAWPIASAALLPSLWALARRRRSADGVRRPRDQAHSR